MSPEVILDDDFAKIPKVVAEFSHAHFVWSTSLSMGVSVCKYLSIHGIGEESEDDVSKS